MRKIHLFFLSVTSGVLLSLPWESPVLGWILLFAFVPLLLADDLHFRQKRTSGFSFSFLLDFIAFLIWNVLSTWWIAYVSLFGMLFVTSLNALFMSIVWWIKNKIHHKLGALSGYFSLIVFWIAFEFLSHYGMLPWPWLILGNGFANTVETIQWYEFTGVLGGSLWILISNILIFVAIKSLSDQLTRKFIRSVGLAVFVIIFPIAVSLYIYSNYTEKGTIQNVVVLQPNIDPYTEKFSGMSSEEQVDRLVSLTESKITNSTDLVLAPETALPQMREDSLVSQDVSLHSFRNIVQQFPNVSFIAGAITQRKFRNNEPVSETAQQSANGEYFFDSFNSAVLINKSGNVQFSHKNILVAGVEKEPFREYFSFLPKIMLDLGGMKGGLASGEESKLLESSSGRKIGPVICFESAFGGHVRQLVRNGAQYIVVLTNDGWWKDSPGVWQHFGYSRIRAIETRRSMVRSANTGISGFINQRGEVIAQTNIDVSEAISSNVTINSSITFYVRYGNYLGWISLLLSGMVGIYLFATTVGKRA